MKNDHLWLRDAGRVKDPHFTLARHRVSSSSVVRASVLDYGGSWVPIPSGAQIFRVPSGFNCNTSHLICVNHSLTFEKMETENGNSLADYIRCFVTSPYCKIRTAQRNNQNCTFHLGPVLFI